jgi:paraquat-inducible protein B
MMRPPPLQPTRQLASVRPQLTQLKQQVDSLKTQLASMDALLATGSDMATVWQLQLQDAMNKQAQAMQMISSLIRLFTNKPRVSSTI